MWEVVKLDSEHGEWKVLGAFESEADALDSFSALSSSNTYILWMGEFPSKIEESIQLYEKVSHLNNGNVVRLTIGAKVEKFGIESACPGSCFCVIANGMRRCETQYCNSNGYCWWVPCGMGC